MANMVMVWSTMAMSVHTVSVTIEVTCVTIMIVMTSCNKKKICDNYTIYRWSNKYSYHYRYNIDVLTVNI